MKNNILHTVTYFVFILFVLVPILYTFTSVLFEDIFLDNLLLVNKSTFFLLLKSVLIASVIALFSTIFGSVLAFLLYKTKLPFRSLFKLILLIPLFISPYILAVAWKDFFYLLFGNLTFIASYKGLVLIMVSVYTPLSIIIVGSALSNINSKIEESAFLITNLKNTILKVILPLIKPALISSFVLVFIFSISEFSVPAYLGVKLFTTEIFIQFSAFYNHSLALIQSFLLILISVILLFSEGKYLSEASFLSIGTKGSSHKTYEIKSGKYWAFGFLIIWLLFTVLMPYFVLIFQAFNLGIESFAKAFELLKPTILNSISLAFVTSCLIVLVGFIVAYFSVNVKNSKFQKSFDWVLLIVFAIPSIILGISFIKFYNQPSLNFIYSSYAIIVIAYIGKFTFISSKLIANAIKQVPKALDEQALLQGVSKFKRIQKILIPIISPTLFAAFVISFIFSLGELGLTIMLYPPGTEIMPIKVFTIMANAPQSLVSSMALIVFSITLFLIVIFHFIYTKLKRS